MVNTTVSLNISNEIGELLKVSTFCHQLSHHGALLLLLSKPIKHNILNILQIEAFPLVSKESSDTTTQEPGGNSSDASASTQLPDPKEKEGGLSGGSVAAIVIFVILGIGAGVYFYRKRTGSGSERMPLSGTSMSSLGSAR